MKLYTFLDENGNVIEQVKADFHAEAIDKTMGYSNIDYTTDFYSEELEDY